MLKRLWLLFAQAVTALLAVFFIVATLKPEWIYAVTKRTSIASEANIKSAPLLSLRGFSCNSDHSCKGMSYAYAAEKAAPSVVKVFSSTEATTPKALMVLKKQGQDLLFDPFFEAYGSRKKPQSAHLGSGVIVSGKGYILTDAHVVNGADHIEVILADGRQTPAKLIGTDAETDLSVLKIDLEHLPVIHFGELKDVRIGDVALAIGNPFGVGQTVTMGIISALGRNDLGISTFENLIQTDAPINPGNSGGALVDVQGNLLGINTAIYSRSGGSLGIGFAIPISTASEVLKSIIATGTVTRGWIGVELQNIYSEQNHTATINPSGVIVSGVLQHGPAAKAGVATGDLIIGITPHTKKLSRKTVISHNQLLELVAHMQPGSKATLHLLRKNKPLNLTVTIGRRPAPQRGTQSTEIEEMEEDED